MELAYLRSGLKYLVITGFALLGLLKIKLTSRPILIILTYHRVLPKHHPDRKFEQPGMVTAPEVLQRHIRLMKALGGTPIHLDDWLKKRKRGEELPKLAVAFTFDDGWRDNFQFAYPILKAEDAPATVFLVTQMLDTNHVFWPERVLTLLTEKSILEAESEFQWLIPYLPNAQPTRSPLNLDQADQVISKLKCLDDSTILSHLDTAQGMLQSSDSNKDNRSILNHTELTQMASEDLVRYGAHTQHHFRLNRIDDSSTLRNEIVGCLDDLNAFGTGIVPIFCYPNGDITGEGEKLVKKHYTGACTTKTGWNPCSRDPFDLHRFNLHDGNSDSARKLLATIGRGSQ